MADTFVRCMSARKASSSWLIPNCSRCARMLRASVCRKGDGRSRFTSGNLGKFTLYGDRVYGYIEFENRKAIRHRHRNTLTKVTWWFVSNSDIDFDRWLGQMACADGAGTQDRFDKWA